ncbi:MAG: 2-dehydro-3-deoxyphosphooctonate aldolase [Verrucomicrobia subdivision 3 bacterium]|nr:2-dehydro-3-deoxyphosphooctonate aldolase [Limisphaerales bacterium]MCS1414212.1 2-dehydro-3-deoxyphosphooctonate aldolase [Limisphaerales bacterium]
MNANPIGHLKITALSARERELCRFQASTIFFARAPSSHKAKLQILTALVNLTKKTSLIAQKLSISERMPQRRSNTLWSSLRKRSQFFLIAGPCVIESESLCQEIATSLRRTCRRLGIHYLFKASYDKANRSSSKSFRGPGLEKGLKILENVRSKQGVPLLTDVHTEAEAVTAGAVVDVLQIPAFLSRQTDLLQAAAETGKIVNIKKGQFASPGEMKNVVNKLAGFGNRQILLTERGTSFGYNNLVADMRSIPIMKQLGCPVVFDATHSVQLPGAGGDRSSGQREFAPTLAKAAVASGADGVFIETHPDPEKTQSDGPSMIPLRDMLKLLRQLLAIRKAVQ